MTSYSVMVLVTVAFINYVWIHLYSQKIFHLEMKAGFALHVIADLIVWSWLMTLWVPSFPPVIALRKFSLRQQQSLEVHRMMLLDFHLMILRIMIITLRER